MRKESVAAITNGKKNVALAGRFFMLGLFALLFCATLFAQAADAQQRSIVNPSFEANNPSGNPGFQFFANNVVPGWDSTNGTVELWDSGFNGVTSYAGAVHAEINSTAVGALYQNVCFTNGEPLRWSFAHRARSGAANPQTAVYEIANSSGVLIQTLATQVTTLAQGWQVNSNNTGLVTYTGPTGLQRLQFRAIDPGSVGNFIDDIQIFLSPYIEFNATTVSQLENFAPSALPANIVLSGTFPSATTLALTITGGTATLGTDYVTPTGTANFTVTIPAGTYSNQAFASGILLRGDRVIEGNETITFSVAGGTGYALASTTVCGAPPVTSVTATIIDDDLNLITTKTANVSTAANGTNVTFSVQVRNTGPLTGTNVALTESLPAGMTLMSATQSTGSYVNPVWTIPSLASGATATLTVVAQVNANTAGSSALINSVTAAQGDQGDTTTAGDDLTETITVPNAPAMTVLKTSSPASFSTVGTALTFNIAVTNSGNVVYPAAPTITDAFVAAAGGSVTCPSGPVAIGATINCTANYTVTQADVNAGKITNVASGAITLGGTPISASDDVVVPGPAPVPAITLVKSITAGSPYTAANQTVSYNYVVTNSGNITLTAPISVADNKIPAVACPGLPVGGLVPGAAITCTGTYSVVQADLDNGSVTNTASASLTQPVVPANPGDPTSVVVTSPQVSKTATATQTSSLTLDKATTLTRFGALGTTVPYTFVVTNTGNTTLTNVSVSDPKLPALTCAVATLAPAGTLNCSASYTVTQPDIDAFAAGTSLVNTASATSRDPGNTARTAQDTNTLPGPAAAPAMTVAKVAQVPSYSTVNAVIRYNITVRNTGNVTWPAAPAVTDPLATVVCPVGSVAPNTQIVCTADYSVTQADIDRGSIQNTASASITVGGVTATGQGSSTLNAVRTTGLTLDKRLASTSPTSFAATGVTLRYEYVLANTGNVTLNAVSVADNLTSVTCPATTIAPGATLICTSTYLTTQANVNFGAVTNTATATSTAAGSAGTPVQSNDDSVTVRATQSPAITMVKSITAGSPYSAANQAVNYSYVVTNSGNISLTAPISVADNRIPTVSCPSLPVGGLIPGDAITCTGIYNVTQADLDTGSVTNTASASLTQPVNPANPGDPTSVLVTSAPDSETATATQTPSLSLDKRIKAGSAVSYTAVGDTVTFEYVVRNTGNVTTTATVTIADDKIPGSLVCAPTGLLPGATAICEQTWVADQAAMNAGTITNTAIASTVFGGNPVASAPDSATVTAVQNPVLTLNKSLVAPIPTLFDVGQVLNYTYSVANGGNVTIAGPITVADNLTTVTCPVVASLAPTDAPVVCTASYTLGTSDLALGSTTNVATASGTFNSTPVRSSPDSVTFPVTAQPALTIDKTTSTVDFDATTDTISYSYLIENSGAAGFTDNIFVDDDKVGSFLCRPLSLGTFSVGATFTCTAAYPVTQADLDRGFVTNNASARTVLAPGTPNALPVQSPSDTVTVNAVGNPELTVAKAVTAGANPAQIGNVLTYTITTTNTGNQTISGVSVSDPLIPTLACTVGGIAAPINVVLAPGGALICTGTYTVRQADIDAQVLDGGVVVLPNTARATGSDPQGATVQDTGSTTHPLAVANASIATVKVIEPSPGTGDAFTTLGQQVDFRVTVTNSGNITLTNIRVTDDLAPSASCTVASLAPTASDSSCTFSYAVTQADLDVQFGTAPNTFGGFTNTATATAQPSNPGAAEVSDSGDVFAKGPASAPAFTLDKNPVTTTFSVSGDVLTYSYTVTNSGNITLTAQPVVTDDKIGSFNCGTIPSGGLLPGNSITCTATYPVTQADVDAGTVVNIANVASTQVPLPSVPGPAQDTATVTGARTPGMTVAKAPSLAGPVVLGNVITYTYTVQNTGNVTLTAVTPGDLHTSAAGTVALAVAGDALDTDAGPITGDTTDAGPNGVWDTLGPDDSVTFTSTYTVTQADIDAGSALTNIVTVTSQSPVGTTPPVATDTASVSVVLPTPAMIVIKTADVTGLSVPPIVGDVVSYSITVENSGNVSLSAVALTDTLTDAGGGAQALDAAPVLASGDDGDGVLQIDETWTYTAAVTLTQAMIDAGGLSNTVTVDARAPDGTDVQDVSDDDGTGTSDPTVTNLARGSAIAVVKTAVLNDGGDGRADVGDTIAYTYVVSNTGNTTLFDTGVTETGFTGAGPAPTPLLTSGGADLDGQGDAPDLAVGGSATYQVSYPLVQGDIDAGLVTNQATATASDPAGTPVQDLSGATAGGDAPTETLLGGAPGLVVLKSADVGALSVPPAVGDILTYTITAENTGNLTISNVTLLDTLTDASGNPQALDAAAVLTSGDDGDRLLGVDETWSYTAQVTLTQAIVDAGGLSNTVTANAELPGGGPISDVSDDDGTGTDDPTVTNFVRLATLTVTKVPSITGNAAVGDVITYTYSVRNSGNVRLTAVTLGDQHTSAAGTVALAIAGDTLLTDGNTVGDSTDAAANGIWDTVGPNDTVTFTAAYTVTQADVDAGNDLVNTVTAAATGPTGTVVPDATATVNVPVLPSVPGITAVKSAVVNEGGDGVANAGDTLTYTYVLTNSGNVTLFDIGLSETGFSGAGTLPVATVQSGGADLDGDADAIDLAPNATATYQAVYRLVQADIDAGAVTNQATATGTDLQGNPVSDLSGATAGDDNPTVTVLVGVPAFVVVKSASAPVYLFPTIERVTFTLDVTNSGNITQTGIQVTDSLPAFIAPAVLLNATYPVTTTATGFTTGTANAAYDGTSVTALLAGNPTLLAGQTGQITITLTYSTTNGGPGGQNIANVSSDQLAGPVPSNPVTVPGGDSDGDGVPDSLEGCGPGDDRDGDGICNAQDYDPTGTFYCEEDGRILPGGNVALSGPGGTQSGVGSSGGITVVRSGADGRFQFFVTAAGTYTLALTYPPGGVPSTTRPSSGTLDVTSLLPANPGSLGSGEAGSTGQLVDFSAGANTYYTTFVFEEGDPFLINNNIPLSACAIRQGVIASKVADRESAVLGETITFTISFNNTTALLYANAALIDILPEGLVYTPGSGTLNGVAAEPTLDGTRLNFGPRDVVAGEQITIRLSARVTSAAGLGKLVNRAVMLDQFGTQISNTATAAVLIKAEQVFSCSDVIGKVFVDRNGNGAQDPDAGRAALTQDEIFLNKYGKLSPPVVAPPTFEKGLAGVRLATVNGLLISTDEFGRYHVPCAALPKTTGSNFTLKLDPRSLPLGYTVTTENPRTLRLTAGKVAKMNFGVSDTKVVDIDLTAAAFEKGSAVPSDALAKGIKGLVADIKTEPSSLRLTYALKPGESKQEAVARLQVVEKMIRKAWRKSGRYELQIQKYVKPVQ
jgi:large repetitive protein